MYGSVDNLIREIRRLLRSVYAQIDENTPDWGLAPFPCCRRIF